MNRMSCGLRVFIYICLIGGAVLFTAPLLWMLSTALKPIDQTMSLPPSWMPYMYYAEIGGGENAVRMLQRINEDSVLVREQESGRLLAVPESKFDGENILNRDEKVRAEFIKNIPASENEPWVVVEEENPADNSAQVRTAVPVGSVRREVCLRWENFSGAIEAMKYFPRYLKNTLILCFLTVVGTVFSSALAAYGFSRIEWKGRDKVFLVALATMMIPFPVVMVPLYCLFRTLGMIGTLKPLWIGTFFAGAFNVFLLRQFFMGIPQALSDAARIDGCSEWGIFWRIILPISRPALMVVGLFQFMGTWNDFLGPLLYLTDQKDYTLALGLQFFQSQSGGTEWNYLMAASALIVIPVLVLFFFTQKIFIEGISTTGIKS